MATTGQEEVLKILDDDGSAVLEDWLQTQREEGVRRPDLFSDREIREQASRLLQAFEQGIRKSSEEVMPDLDQEIWEDLRNVLEDVTRERVERGVSAWEMAAFVLALKRPLFARLRKRLNKRPDALIGEVTQLSRLVDAFAMRTNEYFIAEREAIIERQRHEMLELSTPVVQLWERILTIPLIGTLDSVRAQEVMENLLDAIVEHRAEVVIVDITGVRVVDTQVAQHLLRTAAAVRLMGAESIISGISPKIAQTMVELGVDVGEVTTRPTIRAALAYAMKRVGYEIQSTEKGPNFV